MSATEATYTAFLAFPDDPAALALDDDGLAEVIRSGAGSVEEIDVVVSGLSVGQREARAWDAAKAEVEKNYSSARGRLVAVEERVGFYL